MLDLGLSSADRYAGVDSSQAMLNLLVRKHPKIGALYAADVREVLVERTFSPGQFDWVFLDAAVDLTAAQHAEVERIARLALVLIDGAEWSVRDTSMDSVARIIAHSAKMSAAS